MKHTKEPWAHRNGRIYQADYDVLTIANIARAFDGDYSEENGRRIVVCVNKFAGMTTGEIEQLPTNIPALLTRLSERSLELDKVTEQCDQLLETLEYISRFIEPTTIDGENMVRYAKAAIAVVKESEK